VLTDAGRKAYAKGSEIQSQAERELFGVLTPEESDALHELLDKLQR
jgi:DNA-binding MarR family transcriptional regulator